MAVSRFAGMARSYKAGENVLNDINLLLQKILAQAFEM